MMRLVPLCLNSKGLGVMLRCSPRTIRLLASASARMDARQIAEKAVRRERRNRQGKQMSFHRYDNHITLHA